MTTSEDAIRARRRLTNKILAAHDAQRLRPFLDPGVTLIAGDGGLIQGADQVVQAFAAQFQNPSFVTYLRETDTVTVGRDGQRAAEVGRWTGRWAGSAPSSQSGAYLAAWRKTLGQWVIESELYISLALEGVPPH